MARPRGVPRELIAVRAARELRDGMAVNLGIGLPTLVAGFVPEDVTVWFHAENGILGYGGPAPDGEFDPDLIDASGRPVTLRPGACFMDSAQAFAMIRGGHLDLAVLGGLQVSERGDLANWLVPARGGGSIGGAMDLALGAKRVLVVMEHTTKEGEPRLLRRCTYPLTAPGCVDRVVTDLAVVDVMPGGFVLREVAPGVTPREVQAATAAHLQVAPDLREMEF